MYYVNLWVLFYLLLYCGISETQLINKAKRSKRSPDGAETVISGEEKRFIPSSGRSRETQLKNKGKRFKRSLDGAETVSSGEEKRFIRSLPRQRDASAAKILATPLGQDAAYLNDLFPQPNRKRSLSDEDENSVSPTPAILPRSSTVKLDKPVQRSFPFVTSSSGTRANLNGFPLYQQITIGNSGAPPPPRLNTRKSKPRAKAPLKPKHGPNVVIEAPAPGQLLLQCKCAVLGSGSFKKKLLVWIPLS